MRTFSAILIGLFAAFGAAPSQAQNATVTNDLTFGDIFPGIPKSISSHTPGAAAEFTVSGTAGAEITIDFTLPTYMNSVGYNMQMVFKETDCAMDSSAAPDQTNPGHDNLDPWDTITYRLGSGGLTIWLGGTVVPRLNQKNGDYSASIVLTIMYTGN
ncbi:MAG: DUF4402 domain-containing protein [candidate division Zixibacteria bacterium]|nr:DUF4402 domain-containing protein [candidate division Zixibacteria bacterium]